MTGLKRTVVRAGLESCWLSGAHLLARPFLGGIGVVLTMHRVRPASSRPFQPNRLLEITPDFLEQVILKVRRAGLDLVDLDEAHRRLTTPGRHRRFVALTFDDAYRDNKEHAWPLLERYGAPMTLFVPTAYVDGKGELWWAALEEAIAKQETIAIEVEGERRFLDTSTTARKNQVYDDVYRWLWTLDGRRKRAFVRDLAERYDVDLERQCREAIMGWDEVIDLARQPLVTIGAHTINHPALATLPDSEARREIRGSRDVIGCVLGRTPRHFAYPYGFPQAAGAREFRIAAEEGFETAWTTRAGVLYPEHAQHATALPRVSLNGLYQDLRYLDVFLSGLPFFVWNGFERLNVA
jgi:peptidoglycan/xylan/chitin deacetylase (PgdA/CDA1 family)